MSTLLIKDTKQQTANLNTASTKQAKTIKFPKWAEVSSVFVAGVLGKQLLDNLATSKLPLFTPQPETTTNLAGYEAMDTECDLADLVVEATTQKSGLNIATSITSEMSFAEAFKASRQELGQEGLFIYREELYSNYLASEYSTLSSSEQSIYQEQVKEQLIKMEQMPDNKVMVEKIDANAAETIVASKIMAASHQATDRDSNGETDGSLVNLDDDAKAEIIYDWSSGELFAFVDRTNDSWIDSIWKANADGKLTFMYNLEDPIPAPDLSKIQYQDLDGDGKIDARLHDFNGDNIADRVDYDLKGDGTYGKAYFDTNNDGLLDMVADVDQSGQLLNETSLNQPFASPELYAVAEGLQTTEDFQYEERLTYEDVDFVQPDNAPIASHIDTDLGIPTNADDAIDGLDNDAAMTDWM